MEPSQTQFSGLARLSEQLFLDKRVAGSLHNPAYAGAHNNFSGQKLRINFLCGIVHGEFTYLCIICQFTLTVTLNLHNACVRAQFVHSGTLRSKSKKIKVYQEI